MTSYTMTLDHPQTHEARPRAGTIERRRIIFHEALELMETEYGSDLTLDDMAHRLATSRRQLQRVLADIGGTSFRELLLQIRMRKAREALSEDGVRVRDVARMVGYDQASDFTKTFRRHHGVPPTVYRRGHPAHNGNGHHTGNGNGSSPS